MIFKYLVSFISLLAAQVFFVVFAHAQTPPVAPTILKPSAPALTTAKPLIAGVSLNHTIVEIIIDDVLAGNTATNNHPSGTGNFFFQVEKPLSPGAHTISSRAIDPSNQELKSQQSDIVTITIVPFGAPTIFLKDETILTRAFTYIEGVAHSGSLIHIYLDNADVETFNAGEHQSGASGFSHKLGAPVRNGEHTIYFKAEDGSGRFSLATSEKTITIVDFPAPTILAPKTDDKIIDDIPLVAGIAFNDSAVKISVDGREDGEIKVKNNPSGIGVFNYTIANALERGKSHTVTTKAYDAKGRVSRESNSVVVTVSEYYIPPTLFAVVWDSGTPLVTGVAHNDSAIAIFVDGTRDSLINGNNHPSGTLYFEARIKNLLTPGAHKITAQAFDMVKKPSQISNTIMFTSTATFEENAPSVVEPTPYPTQEEKSEKTAETKEAPASVEKTTEGQVTTEDEEKAKITEETQAELEEKNGTDDKIERATNWPLVGGVLLLVILGILFVAWYLGGKRRLLNEGIDRLFAEDNGGTPPEGPSSPNPSLFSEDIELPGEMGKETTSRSAQDIPPPPPPSI